MPQKSKTYALWYKGQKVYIGQSEDPRLLDKIS